MFTPTCNTEEVAQQPGPSPNSNKRTGHPHYGGRQQVYSPTSEPRRSKPLFSGWNGKVITVPLGPNKALRYNAICRVLQTSGVHPRRILEIGCGQGAIGSRLAETGEYLGVELDPRSAAVAKSRLQHLGRGDIRNIGYEQLDSSERFDLVCALEVIEHMAEDETTMKSWANLVAPGGLLLLSTPAFQARYTAYDKYVGHYRRYEPTDLADLLSQQGLVDVKVRHYGYPLYNLTELLCKHIAQARLKRVPPARSLVESTAASGRVSVVPNALLQTATIAGSPFVLVQRLFPNRGPGLLALGRKPL